MNITAVPKGHANTKFFMTVNVRAFVFIAIINGTYDSFVSIIKGTSFDAPNENIDFFGSSYRL